MSFLFSSKWILNLWKGSVREELKDTRQTTFRVTTSRLYSVRYKVCLRKNKTSRHIRKEKRFINSVSPFFMVYSKTGKNKGERRDYSWKKSSSYKGFYWNTSFYSCTRCEKLNHRLRNSFVERWTSGSFLHIYRNNF